MPRYLLPLAMAAILWSLATAETQQIAGVSPGPEEILGRAIARDAYGPVELVPRPARMYLEVNGRAIPPGGAVLPIAPGATVRIRALVAEDEAASAPQGVASTTIRRTVHSEMVWTCDPAARLAPGPGGDVFLQAENNAEGAVRVSAAHGSIHISRGMIGGFSPDEAVPAALYTGEASVTVLVGRAFDRRGDGLIDRVNIGIYPNESADSAPASVRDRAELYRPPSVFHRIDSETANLLITPHRTLGQLHPPVFAETAGEVRYAPLSPRLIEFLEAFELQLEERGYRPDRLQVIRGFVSPTDRLRLQAQGESVAAFSRLLYGDGVALVYTDDGQPRMSDFNGDGATDVADVQALADIAKTTMDTLQMFGGLGIARAFPGEGPAKGTPYLHLDLRGFYAPFRE